jgi:hypothetical protein
MSDSDRADLLALGTIIARQQVVKLFGNKKECAASESIIAGVLAAAKILLPPEVFRRFVIGNEIDPTALDNYLDLAQANQ